MCSRWEEPFGRTSLEASSRGCALIISNKGGLPETTNHALVLKKLTSKEIFNKIQFLIINTSKRQSLQKKNYNGFRFTHEFITSLQDNIRFDILKSRIFFINKINKNSKLKILHVTNFNERHNGRLHYNTGKKIK